MKNLRFRCPNCQRLFEADPQDIKSHNPQFDCLSCQTRFGFFYPPMDPAQIRCFEIPKDKSLASFREHLRKELTSTLQKSEETCPKCGAVKFINASECYSCGVIFAKLDGLPQDPSLRAQPSLVRKWKQILEDYDNEQLHEEFFASCRELGALAFASSKYEEIRQAQGYDSRSEKMLKRIQALTSVEFEIAKEEGALDSQHEDSLNRKLNRDFEEKSRALLDRAKMQTDLLKSESAFEWPKFFSDDFIRWLNQDSKRLMRATRFLESYRRFEKAVSPIKPYLPLSPYVIALSLILLGLFNLSHRNSIGAGVAIALLGYGFGFRLNKRTR